MRLLLAISLFLFATSCKKNESLSKQTLSRSELQDYKTLQSVIDKAKDGEVIYLDNRTYILSHSLILTKSLSFIGQVNTVITRENQITYYLNDTASSTSKSLILTNTDGLMAGDRMIIALDSSVNGATQCNTISSIKGDTVNFDLMIGNINGGIGNSAFFPINTKMFKSIDLFKIPGYGYYQYYQINPVFENIVFDGNRDKNKGSHYWAINTALSLLTSGKGFSTVENCEIKNSPGESVVGHNMRLINCYLHDLNGSGYHASEDRINSKEEEIHSDVMGNRFENTNQILTSITGHSEGAITHSNSGSYYTATQNSFINVGESVLGDLYASVSENDWGTNNIIFENNTINGAGRIIHSIYTGGNGVIRNVNIEDNFITNMPLYNYSEGLARYPGIILKQ